MFIVVAPHISMTELSKKDIIPRILIWIYVHHVPLVVTHPYHLLINVATRNVVIVSDKIGLHFVQKAHRSKKQLLCELQWVV